MSVFLYIVIILIVETMAITALKHASLKRRSGFLMLALMLYTLVAYLLVGVYRLEDLSIVNALWSAFSVLAVVIIGALVFQERLTMRTAVGIALTMAGIVILRG